MAIYPNPEHVLKRADELVNVGQKQQALQLLHDLVTSKNFRSWQKPHENIMFRYVELCVELRKELFAKDGLIQYRNSRQHVNVSSFEEVTRHFLWLVTEKAEQAEALDEDEEEAFETDKDFIIVRSDRDEKVTPWLKYLWEADLIVLEILRNNSKLEALYAVTARNAFQFCKQYKRTTEFRKLCEIIRNHLANLNKYRDQRDQPDLTAPESLELYLTIRFEQLQVATELGLWQEAFRSVEDIYGLMCMVKKTPKPSFLQDHFNNPKAVQLISSSIVLAALSVPPFGQAHENEKEHNLKMANLIDFNLEPELEGRDILSRESLLSELVSKGVLSCATQEVKDLYHIMEHEFQPLDLGSKVKPLLDRISSLPEICLSQYVPSLEKLATLKLLQQVSKMYQTITIAYLAQLIPFFDFSVVEKISVDAVKNNFIAMKVDHVKGVVIFGNPVIDESDCLRSPLAIFAETLNKVRAMLFPVTLNLGDVIPNLEETVETERKRLIARKSIIEKRKEEQERQLLEMEREEEQINLKLVKLTEEAEQKRLAIEVEERRRQRIPREMEEKVITKQTMMEKTLSEKIKEYQVKEKKLQKLFKTMDYLERAKREEAAPLIEAAYQQRLVEEKEAYEREPELRKGRYERDLMERNRLIKMINNKDLYEERVNRLRLAEIQEQKIQIIQARRQELEMKRKKYYLRSEEERRRLLLS